MSAYIRDIESLADTLPLTFAVLAYVQKEAVERYDEFVEKHCEVEVKDDTQRLKFDASLLGRFKRLKRPRDNTSRAGRLVPRTIIVSLVSQYDAFLGALIRTLLLLRPELLNASEKNMTFSQLLEFGTVELAREYIVEKEVEGVLRKSHSEQFDWLEAQFDLPLRKGLDSWPTFIELTERRNLFVHTSGIISSQYLSVCRKNGVPLESSLAPGKELQVSPEYLKLGYACLFEIGVKLAHVLWRKLLPQQREAADGNLIEITYDLISDRSYHLAMKLLDFATDVLKTHSSDRARRTLIVNRAQTYKWLSRPGDALRILEEEDWSASSDEFQVCVAVLREQYDRACVIMKRIGPSGAIGKGDYRVWPVFQEFRKTSQFLATFEALYGEPFVLLPVDEPDTSASTERPDAPDGANDTGPGLE